MGKFARDTLTLPALGPTGITGVRAATHEGGIGYEKDPKTALFTLGLTNMVGEATFYESPSKRDERFIELVRVVAATDPAWVLDFAGWLRDKGNMRSATVVVAVEALQAGHPDATAVIDAACVRADEPAEILGYWLANYGRKIPNALRKGLRLAIARLYTERNMVRYDSSKAAVRPGDVLELVHPTPVDPTQSALFRYLIDRRHGRADARSEGLSIVSAIAAWEQIDPDHRRADLRENGLPEGISWERLAGWLPGGMDAEAWESVIPTMGYMALLRNLRNFEEARVSAVLLNRIAERLGNPAEVAKSRQFPYRFASAWKATQSMTFGPALERAVDAACANIPEFTGRSLVMVDVSGSMADPMSGRSRMQRWEAAAIFAGAIAKRSNADIHIYNQNPSGALGVRSALRFADEIRGQIGGGTDTWNCVRAVYRPGEHDRVIVLTDEQSIHTDVAFIDRSVPVYVWDLAGYKVSDIAVGPNRFLLGGLSDAAFNVVPLLERGHNAPWPWEVDAG